jgi:hypothetical protein
MQFLVCMRFLYATVFQFDPGFQEDPNQPFSESDEEVIDTDGNSFNRNFSH